MTEDRRLAKSRLAGVKQEIDGIDAKRKALGTAVSHSGCCSCNAPAFSTEFGTLGAFSAAALPLPIGVVPAHLGGKNFFQLLQAAAEFPGLRADENDPRMDLSAIQDLFWRWCFV